MEILREEKTIKFEDIETEGVVPELVEYLKELNGEEVTIDLEMCEDLHTAIIQPLGAYKLLHKVNFIFNGQNSAYKMALETFSYCEDTE